MRRILFLGAGVYQKASIQKARNTGFEVLVLDQNEEAPARASGDHFFPVNITDQIACMEIAQKWKVDGIVPVNDFGVRTAAYVSTYMGLPGISQHAAECACDKGHQREAWKKAGLPQPAFQVITSRDEIHSAVRAIGLPVVVKPTDSGGASRGVSIVREEASLPWAFDFAYQFARNRRVIIERWVAGVESTVETLSQNERTEILAISDKRLQNHDTFCVDMGVYYPATFPPHVIARINEIVIEAHRAIGIDTGAGHVELLVDGEEINLVEMGARPGGGHIFSMIVAQVSGVDMVREYCRIMTNQTADFTPKVQRGCCYMFFDPPYGKLTRIEGIKQVKAMDGVMDVGIHKKTGDILQPVSRGTDRAGFIVTSGKNREEAKKRAEEASRYIHFIVDPVVPEESS